MMVERQKATFTLTDSVKYRRDVLSIWGPEYVTSPISIYGCAGTIRRPPLLVPGDILRCLIILVVEEERRKQLIRNFSDAGAKGEHAATGPAPSDSNFAGQVDACSTKISWLW